ncbi:MAG: metalloprotease family protein [Candidatus Diapherotrites archaeon]|nr:metalloprotease family protein [Candidatus Diapherotrites archaeon]
MAKEPIIFFPGIVFHELSHVVACAITGVKVHKVKWFGTDEAFVQHAKPNAWQGLVISIAPFLLGNFIAFELLLFGHAIAAANALLALVIYWFALSLLLYAFPSKTDAMNAFSAFTDFYRRHVIEKGSLATRFFWLLTFPFFFVPVIVLLGLILLFDSAFVLRGIWVLLVLAASLAPAALL